ncbi:protocadherin beta-1-like [Latimeria chalumnae]|uniref:protocadherin beta-1-like n=1 Tax=Latimeria chalumnae TaxID=7897 RepID=UPI00313DDB08
MCKNSENDRGWIREALCGQFQSCLLNFQLVIEDHLELHHTEVEINDINDNVPAFPKNEIFIQMQEIRSPGSVFFLQIAQDPDVGTNGLQNYQISHNEHFYLEIRTRGDGSKFAQLKSGTACVHIVVMDANDNSPVFSQELHEVSVLETFQEEHLIIVVNAIDLDEGSNGEITYSFPSISGMDQQMFKINFITGGIRLTGVFDFEEVQAYEIDVQATDRGGLSMHCKVLLRVIDVNDNAPELEIMSVNTPLPEDSPPETVVALFIVKDLDSGENGKVSCSIQENLPFILKFSINDFYELLTSKQLDRERISEYNITITAIDAGSPHISSQEIIQIKLTDVNDNPPTFNQTSYTIFLKENNRPGACIGFIQARDVGYKENARIIYSLIEKHKNLSSSSALISINSESGNIYVLQSFNFEELQELHFCIEARDCGSPSLSSIIAVNVIIVDENDNAPQVLYPLQNVT